MAKGWITAEDVAKAKEIIATVSAEKAAHLSLIHIYNAGGDRPYRPRYNSEGGDRPQRSYGNNAGGDRPVSYTHLDVYKRQGASVVCAFRCCNECMLR